MDSTLDKRIAAMRGSLMDTALEAAESRGQRLAGVAHVLYALYRDDGFAGRLLRAHGLESAEIRRLMGTVPNMPLADGDWKCVAYTDSQRTELTVHINGNRVGLYKADGTVLKPVGKD